MKELCNYIPPIAADYSGACSVLFEMNTLCILYTPGGCVHPIVEIDEIRDLNETFLFSTKLNDIEVIMGTEDKFLKSAEILVSNHPGIDFISIVGTPITSITGVSLNSLGKKLEVLTKKPVLVFETSGFENYALGIDMTLKKLAKQIIEQNKNIEHKRNKKQCINIIGYNPLSLGHKNRLDEFVRILRLCKLKVCYFPSSEKTLKLKNNFLETAVNLVVSAEGIGVAKDLYEIYGMPFIVNIPVGIHGMNILFLELKKYLNFHVNEGIYLKYASLKRKKYLDKNVLIIGEPLLSTAISQCLQHDFSLNNIKIVSVMNCKGKLNSIYSSDLFSQIESIDDEEKITKYIRESRIIIADPIFKNLICKKDEDCIFIPMPHPGLSGREFSKNEYEYIGKKGFDYFNKYLNIF